MDENTTIVIKGDFIRPGAVFNGCPYAGGYLSRHYVYDVRAFRLGELAMFGMSIHTMRGELHAIKHFGEEHPFFVDRLARKTIEKALSQLKSRITI
jgi:hypothetical protein